MNERINLYECVMGRLRAKPMSQRAIASASGVPFSTLTKIAQGAIKDPSVHTIQRLYDFFEYGEEHKEAA